VVVLTGSGPAFCAGADLTAVAGGLNDRAAIERLFEEAGKLTLRLEAHPAPVVAALNGAAVAGGLELVEAAPQRHRREIRGRDRCALRARPDLNTLRLRHFHSHQPSRRIRSDRKEDR
jgi:Enoyl-CoA hydratase/isomerase